MKGLASLGAVAWAVGVILFRIGLGAGTIARVEGRLGC